MPIHHPDLHLDLDPRPLDFQFSSDLDHHRGLDPVRFETSTFHTAATTLLLPISAAQCLILVAPAVTPATTLTLTSTTSQSLTPTTGLASSLTTIAALLIRPHIASCLHTIYRRNGSPLTFIFQAFHHRHKGISYLNKLINNHFPHMV